MIAAQSKAKISISLPTKLDWPEEKLDQPGLKAYREITSRKKFLKLKDITVSHKRTEFLDFVIECNKATKEGLAELAELFDQTPRV